VLKNYLHDLRYAKVTFKPRSLICCGKTKNILKLSWIKFNYSFYVQFKNANYGDLVVCISRTQPGIEREIPPLGALEVLPETSTSRSLEDEVQDRCQPLKADKELTFRFSQPCGWEINACKPIYFMLRVQATDTLCFGKYLFSHKPEFL